MECFANLNVRKTYISIFSYLYFGSYAEDLVLNKLQILGKIIQS